MTAIPARAAGVGEVVVCCPRPDAAVFAAAIEAGVDRLFRVGGAHAIAAMAYGTTTVPRVDKIVGPGNRWVSAAKSLISADCGIDFYAGPTEILIVTSSGPASWIAADLLAQAEHDPDARAVMITTSRTLAERVSMEVERQMPGSGPARQSIARHGGIIVCRNVAEAIALANDCGLRTRRGRKRIAGQADRERRRDLRRRLDGAGRRRLRDRLEPRPADRRRCEVSRRLERRGLRQAGVGATPDKTRTRVDRPDRLRPWRERKASRPTPDQLK